MGLPLVLPGEAVGQEVAPQDAELDLVPADHEAVERLLDPGEGPLQGRVPGGIDLPAVKGGHQVADQVVVLAGGRGHRRASPREGAGSVFGGGGGVSLEERLAGVPDHSPAAAGGLPDRLHRLGSPDSPEGLGRLGADQVSPGHGNPESPAQDPAQGRDRLRRLHLPQDGDGFPDGAVLQDEDAGAMEALREHGDGVLPVDLPQDPGRHVAHLGVEDGAAQVGHGPGPANLPEGAGGFPPDPRLLVLEEGGDGLHQALPADLPEEEEGVPDQVPGRIGEALQKERDRRAAHRAQRGEEALPHFPGLLLAQPVQEGVAHDPAQLLEGPDGPGALLLRQTPVLGAEDAHHLVRHRSHPAVHGGAGEGGGIVSPGPGEGPERLRQEGKAAAARHLLSPAVQVFPQGVGAGVVRLRVQGGDDHPAGVAGDGVGVEGLAEARGGGDVLLHGGVQVPGLAGDRLQGGLVGLREIVLVRFHQESLEGLPDAAQIGVPPFLLEAGGDGAEVGGAPAAGGEDLGADGEEARAELPLRFEERGDQIHDHRVGHLPADSGHQVGGAVGERNLVEDQVHSQPGRELQERLPEVGEEGVEGLRDFLPDLLGQAAHEARQVAGARGAQILHQLPQHPRIGGQAADEALRPLGGPSGGAAEEVADDSLPGPLVSLRRARSRGAGLRGEDLLQVNLADLEGGHAAGLEELRQPSLPDDLGRVRRQQAQEGGEGLRVESAAKGDPGDAPVEEVAREGLQGPVVVRQELPVVDDARVAEPQLNLRFAREQAVHAGEETPHRHPDGRMLRWVEGNHLGGGAKFAKRPVQRLRGGGRDGGHLDPHSCVTGKI